MPCTRYVGIQSIHIKFVEESLKFNAWAGRNKLKFSYLPTVTQASPDINSFLQYFAFFFKEICLKKAVFVHKKDRTSLISKLKVFN